MDVNTWIAFARVKPTKQGKIKVAAVLVAHKRAVAQGVSLFDKTLAVDFL